MAFEYQLPKNVTNGYSLDNRGFRYRLYDNYGALYYDDSREYAIPQRFGVRSLQTANPPQPLDSGGKLFRAPSDWFRSGRRVRGHPSSVKAFYAGSFYDPNTGQVIPKRSYIHHEGNAMDTYGSDVQFLPPGVGVSGEVGLGYDPNLYNRVVTELLQKVGARKVNYGEALGESRQTINHLARTASDVVRALLAARKGRWGDVAKHLGVHPRQVSRKSPSAQRWLEYQYAWLPLMSDIYDTAGLLNEGFRKKAQIMSSVRQLSRPFDKRDYPIGYETKPPSGDGSYTYRGKVYYKVNDSTLAKFNQMGLINPLEVAWALTPYSFVVDWFLPIGNMLEALTATVGVDFIAGYMSIKSTGSYTTHYLPGSFPIQPGWFSHVEGEFSTTNDFSSYHRQKLTSFPLPRPYLKSPFSTTHAISAIALIRQLIR